MLNVTELSIDTIIKELPSNDSQFSKFLKEGIGHDILRSYKQFVEFYSYCPTCRSEKISKFNHSMFFFLPKYTYFKEKLLEKMSVVNSLVELNKEDDHYFGIICDDCFSIANNIQGSISEFHKIRKFIETYRNCPTCGAQNHESTLIRFYHNNKKRHLRNMLIRHMNDKDLNVSMEKNNIKLGIPCCKCFDIIFISNKN